MNDTEGTMTAIVEDMDAGTADASAASPPAAPATLDDASLDRLADLLRARIHPTRPAWQTSLLVTLAGTLIAAAAAGYFTLRGDIATGNESLRAEIASVDESLRAELLDFRAEFHRMNIDHTERLTRLETVQAQHTEQLVHIEAELAQHTERLAHIEAVQAQHTEQLAQHTEQHASHTERLTRIEAAHPHPATP